jgi:hypothetical protein
LYVDTLLIREFPAVVSMANRRLDIGSLSLKAGGIGACALAVPALIIFLPVGSFVVFFVMCAAGCGFCIGGIGGGLFALCRLLVRPRESALPLDARLLVRRALAGLAVSFAFALGLGLAILALTRVRHEANIRKCENNLRQVAVALVSHDQTYGVLPLAVAPVLPPGVKYSVRIPPGGPLPGLPVERRFSWQAEVMPFMGSWPTFGHLEFWKAWDEGENLNRVTWVQLGGKGGPLGPLVPNVMRWYQCPNGHDEVIPGVTSLTNYVGVAGVGPDAAELPKSDRRAGVFGYDRQIAICDVTNRLGSTLAAIETGYANGPWAAGGFATTRGFDPARRYLGADGQFDMGHRAADWVSTPGLTNAAFVDGSCRRLSERMDATILEAMATVSGREGITPEF